jgi:hypothetical protein
LAGGYYEKHKAIAVSGYPFHRVDLLRGSAGRGLEGDRGLRLVSGGQGVSKKGHIYWVGEFSGTFANDKGKGSPLDHTGWKCPGSNDLDLNNKKGKAAGYCIVSDPSGDLAYAAWQCLGDTETCNGTFEYTGGTGKYQGISASNTFVGHTQVNWPDGTASGHSTFNR